MTNTKNNVLSRKTRNSKKKKIMPENESDDNALKKGEPPKITRRISDSISSVHLSNYVIASKPIVTSKNKNARNDNNPSSDMDTSEDNDNNNLLEPPGTPVPQSKNSLQSDVDGADKLGGASKTLTASIQYDSVDEYDTDDLLNEVDSIGPLRHKLVETRQGGKKIKIGIHKYGGKNSSKLIEKMKSHKYDQALSRYRYEYNHERTMELHSNYPDNYWKYHADNSTMIGEVNSATSLELIHHVKDQGPVLGMTLSKDGILLAIYCSLGTVRIYDVENRFGFLYKLRDDHELQIDEFYCGLFHGEYLLATGKLKDRHRWSVEDDDCHILPCPIKIFDLNGKEVVCKLEGHEEEVLCVKYVQFEKKNYYVSTSQDGYIIKWHVGDDWKTLIESTKMADGITCMAFSISFLPNTGNKYFMGACDAHLRLYDFENSQLLQTFEGLYTSYCDCGKFIKWLDEEYYLTEEMTPSLSTPVDPATKHYKKKADKSTLMNIENDKPTTGQGAPLHAWIITRGAEMVDGNTISIPNSCTLHQLVYPTKTGGEFKLKEVRKYDHVGYRANSWMVKISTNGRYLFAPTMEGQIFIFNLLTGQMTGILKKHDDVEVRDVILHPFAPLMFSCGDDGVVNVYSYSNRKNEDSEEEDDTTDDKNELHGNNNDKLMTNDVDKVLTDDVDQFLASGVKKLMGNDVIGNDE